MEQGARNEVRLETWDDGNCIGQTEVVEGTAGDQVVDHELSSCLTIPLGR